MNWTRFLSRKNKGKTATSGAKQAIIDRSTVSTGRKAVETATGSSSNSAIARQMIDYHGKDLTGLLRMDAMSILRVLFTVDSTASHALSNFMRLFDSGYFMTARDFEGAPIESAGEFMRSLEARYNLPVTEGFSEDRSIRSLCCRAVMYALFTGAVAIEVEFDPGYVNTNIHLVDPMSIDFYEEKLNGGAVNVPYFASGREKVPLNYKNFIYVPVDPILDDLYGTSQFVSAITPILNKVRLLQDFARALKNLGFDRIDIQIDEAAIIEACRKKGIKDPEEIEKTITGVIDAARQSFQDLDVDDNPAHLSSIILKPLEGKNGGRQIDLTAIVNVMMSDIASGLKTFATILGKAFNRSSEGYQSIEALLYLKMVQGFQGFVERIMERVFTVVLQVEGGIPGTVDFEFIEPSIRPTYELGQYFGSFQTMLWSAEKLGHISQAESSRVVRRMLALPGDPPPDAQRDDAYTPGATNSPERDASKEDGKEDKRAETNKNKKASGSSK